MLILSGIMSISDDCRHPDESGGQDYEAVTGHFWLAEGRWKLIILYFVVLYYFVWSFLCCSSYLTQCDMEHFSSSSSQEHPKAGRANPPGRSILQTPSKSKGGVIFRIQNHGFSGFSMPWNPRCSGSNHEFHPQKHPVWAFPWPNPRGTGCSKTSPPHRRSGSPSAPTWDLWHRCPTPCDVAPEVYRSPTGTT